MDTKPAELTAEFAITSALLGLGIKTAKPHFDQRGADLIGFAKFSDGSKFCRIQCKYRNTKSKSPIAIPAKHLKGPYILVLYVEHLSGNQLFCFLPDDIKTYFRKSGTGVAAVYRLTLTQSTLVKLNEDPKLVLDRTRALSIRNLIKSAAKLDPALVADLITLIQSGKQLAKLATRIDTHQKKIDRLQDLIHRCRVAEMTKNHADEKLQILSEYLAYIETMQPELSAPVNVTKNIHRRRLTKSAKRR